MKSVGRKKTDECILFYIVFRYLHYYDLIYGCVLSLIMDLNLFRYVWPFYNIMHERVNICRVLQDPNFEFNLDLPKLWIVRFVITSCPNELLVSKSATLLQTLIRWDWSTLRYSTVASTVILSELDIDKQENSELECEYLNYFSPFRGKQI